jgi:hypothetical protein
MNPVKHACSVSLRSGHAARAFGFMLLTTVGVFAVFLAVVVPIHVAAEEPARLVATTQKLTPASVASPDEISRWIDELGHDAFTVRQSAASQLLAAGMSAREPLMAVVDGPDPERRAAARRLVALIDQSEFHRKLEAFAADTEGRQHLTLPGWEQYQKLIGSDAAARALFVEMQRHEGGLLAAMFGASKQPPSDLLESRLVRVVQLQNMGGVRSFSPQLGSSAALLFLGSIAEIEVSDDAARLIEMLLQRPPFLESLRSDNRQDAVHRLAVAWLLHCPAKNENILQQRLSIISQIGVEDALPLPRAVIKGDDPYKRTQPSTRALATLVIGQFGGAEDMDRLEPLLENSANCNGLQQLPGQPSVQVRDVALVVMLQLTGQRPADYGYVNARLQSPKLFQLATLGRENDQQRAEAIAKWRQWRAENKNSPEPQKPKS